MKYNNLRNNDYQFSNFTRLASNDKAITIANEFIDTCINGNHKRKIFRIVAASGMGKTHLLYAIAKHILGRVSKTKLIIVSSTSFQSQLIEAIKSNSITQLVSYYEEADAILVDDIDYLVGKSKIQEVLSDIIEGMLLDKKSVLLTSNSDISTSSSFENKFKTQIKSSIIGSIDPLNVDQKTDFISLFSHEEGITIDEEIIDYIALNFSDSISSLLGILKSIKIDREKRGVPITKDYVQKILNKYEGTYKKSSIFIQVPKEIRTSLKQYFEFFNDYASRTTGIDYNLEISSTPNGLILEVSNISWEDKRLKEDFEKYLSYVKNKVQNVEVENTSKIENSDLRFLNLELKNQVRFLQSSLEIRDFKIEFLSTKLSGLPTNLDDDRNITIYREGVQAPTSHYFAKENMNNLKLSIANGSIDQVINELMSTTDLKTVNSLVLIKSRLNRTKRLVQGGLIEESEATGEFSRINASLLSLIDSIVEMN